MTTYRGPKKESYTVFYYYFHYQQIYIDNYYKYKKRIVFFYHKNFLFILIVVQNLYIFLLLYFLLYYKFVYKIQITPLSFIPRSFELKKNSHTARQTTSTHIYIHTKSDTGIVRQFIIKVVQGKSNTTWCGVQED